MTARDRSYLVRLRGPIKNYAWGSRTVLAGLARRPPSDQPEAELWLGAHPQGPAEVDCDGEWRSLRDAIDGSPVELLGVLSVDRFGAELPFLLKLMAIEQPLSIQVHPDGGQAAAGFRRERALGRSAEEGNYRDPRHKPELLVALEPLWALRGLLEPGEIRRRFAEARIASYEAECDRLARSGVAGLPAFLGGLLGIAGAARERLLVEAREAATRSRQEPLTRDSPLYWLARLVDLHPRDPAVLAPLFLHLIRLSPGQGIFQAPRVLHSYLEGVGVEVMANSDNVVRAGLTPKAIDLAELLAVAELTPSPPSPIEPRSDGIRGVSRYAGLAEEFELVRLDARPSDDVALPGPASLMLAVCTRGAGRLEAPERGEILDLESGGAFAVRPNAGRLRLAGDLEVYAATVAPRSASGSGGASP